MAIMTCTSVKGAKIMTTELMGVSVVAQINAKGTNGELPMAPVAL